MSEPEALPHRSRKNTRRWCRGKPGREHTAELRQNPHFSQNRCGTLFGNFYLCVEQLWCTTCGKVLRWSLGDDCSRRPAT